MDENGQAIGAHIDNHLLSTLVYDVEFTDGDVKKYSANLIAENILSQVNPDGFYTNVLEEILDHKRYGTAVHLPEKHFKTKQGRKKHRQTIVGGHYK